MNPIRYQKRICFSKEGRMKFVGHLDLLRVFQRAMNRAGIDLIFSQGFNPHPQMSFAQPLSLGVTGRREYMELQLASDWDNQALLDTLNAQLPLGLHAMECRSMPEGTKSAMALATHALYHIVLPAEYAASYPCWLEDFLALEKIPIVKLAKFHGRKQEVTVDIKPYIESLRLSDDHTLILWCSCSNTENLKPDRMMKVFWESAGHPELAGCEAIDRQDLFRQEGESRTNLMELLPEN